MDQSDNSVGDDEKQDENDLEDHNKTSNFPRKRNSGSKMYDDFYLEKMALDAQQQYENMSERKSLQSKFSLQYSIDSGHSSRHKQKRHNGYISKRSKSWNNQDQSRQQDFKDNMQTKLSKDVF